MNPSRIVAEVLGVLLLVAALAYGCYTVWGWRAAALANAATVHQQAATAAATSQIATTSDAKTEDAHRVEVVVTDNRAHYDQQYSDLKAHDAAVADWAGRPIPDSLRAIARARRLSRDGPSADPAGRP